MKQVAFGVDASNSGYVDGPQFIADCVRTVYLVKNSSSAGTLFSEIVGKKSC